MYDTFQHAGEVALAFLLCISGKGFEGVKKKKKEKDAGKDRNVFNYTRGRPLSERRRG